MEEGPIRRSQVEHEQTFSEDLEVARKPVFLDEPAGDRREAIERLPGGRLPFVLDHEDPFPGGRVAHAFQLEHGYSLWGQVSTCHIGGQVSTCHFASRRWQGLRGDADEPVIREYLTPLDLKPRAVRRVELR